MMVHPIHSIVEWWVWILFTLPCVILVMTDVLLLDRHRVEKTSVKASVKWAILWVSMAILFGLFLWWHLHQTKSSAIANEYALMFFTGYVIEELVSIENMFVIFLIFNYFKLPALYHRQALMLGIIGAIVFRFIMIMSSVWLISHLYWLIYLLGVFLIYAGIKTLFFLKEEQISLSKSKILQWMYRNLKITDQYKGRKFVVIEKGISYFTPLFVVVMMIQVSDIFFAMEILPAIFGITEDPFIIYSSNILAILGLRSMYFLVENLSKQFYLLKHCISIIFIFIGCKMLISHWVQISTYHTASIVFTVIICSIILSIITKKA